MRRFNAWTLAHPVAAAASFGLFVWALLFSADRWRFDMPLVRAIYYATMYAVFETPCIYFALRLQAKNGRS